MRPEAYRKLRQSIGSQRFVAKRLGVHWRTISNREQSSYTATISREVEYGLRHLAEVVAREKAAEHGKG